MGGVCELVGGWVGKCGLNPMPNPPSNPHREMKALSPTFSARCANFADTTTALSGMTIVGSASADLAGMTMPAGRATKRMDTG